MSHFLLDKSKTSVVQKSPRSGLSIIEEMRRLEETTARQGDKHFKKSINVAQSLKSSLDSLEFSLKSMESEFINEEAMSTHNKKDSNLSETTYCTLEFSPSSISPSRVVGCLDPSLICTNCSCLVNQPKECKECQTLFCLSCALYLNSCPRGCPSQGFRAVKIVERFLERLSVRCTYEKEGCTQLLQIGQIKSHEDSCLYRTEKCNSRICNNQISVWREEKFCSTLCEMVNMFQNEIKEGTKELKLYKFKKFLASSRTQLYDEARREVMDKYFDLKRMGI